MLIFCHSNSHLFAQSSTLNYDLSQYKLPDLKRQVLEASFDLSGYGYRSENQSIYEIPAWDRTVQTGYFDWVTQVHPYYSLYLNREKLQSSQNLSTNFRLNNYNWVNTIEDDNPSTTKIKRNLLYPQLNYSGEFREFFNHQLFVEQGIEYGLSYNGEKDFDDERDSTQQSIQDELYKNRNTNSDLEITLAAGWGRIERVEDARLAVYILDDLIKAGKLTREVTDRDIQQVAETISRLQNERFFDNREKQIWQLQQLDSVMHELGLTESADMVYFTLMKDNWDYAAGPVRSSGFQLAGGIRGGLDLSHTLTENTVNYYLQDSVAESGSDEFSRNLMIGGLLRLTYEKPVNLYWQFSIQNSLFLSYTGWMSDYSGYDPETEYQGDNQRQGPVFSDDLYLRLAYYPNSRTTMSMYSSSSLYMSLLADDSGAEDWGLSVYSGLGMDVYYYFSPRIRLDLNGDIYGTFSQNRNDTDYTANETRVSGSFSAGLVYKFL